MKLITLKHLFLALSTAFLLAACSSGSNEEAVIKDYINAIAKGDNTKALALVDFSGQNVQMKEMYQDKLLAGFKEMRTQKFDAHNGLKSVEITRKIISDDKNSAIIHYTINLGDGTTLEERTNLVKIDGKWLISVSIM